MFIPFPELQLAFTDFTLLALILLVMYSISVLESSGIADNRAASGIDLLQRKRAATWAWVGSLSTLIAGVVAASEEGRNDVVWLTIPLLFMAHWAYFHWSTSRMLDAQAVLQHFDDAYRKAILAALAPQPGREGLTIEQIRELATQSNAYIRLLTAGSPMVQAVVPLPVKDVVTRLLPNKEKTEQILNQLVDEKVVSLANGVYFLPKA